MEKSWRSHGISLRHSCGNPALCHGIIEGLLNKLQHIQNAAARLVTDTRKYDHITPVLRDLHWLPIRQRIVFKLTTMVYKCQHGLCPSYLEEDCILLSATRGRQHLRSAGRLELLVPRTRTVTFGPRAFTVAGPGVWNSLPPALREPTLSFNCFRRGVKELTHSRSLLLSWHMLAYLLTNFSAYPVYSLLHWF